MYHTNCVILNFLFLLLLRGNNSIVISNCIKKTIHLKGPYHPIYTSLVLFENVLYLRTQIEKLNTMRVKRDIFVVTSNCLPAFLYSTHFSVNIFYNNWSRRSS